MYAQTSSATCPRNSLRARVRPSTLARTAACAGCAVRLAPGHHLGHIRNRAARNRPAPLFTRIFEVLSGPGGSRCAPCDTGPPHHLWNSSRRSRKSHPRPSASHQSVSGSALHIRHRPIRPAILAGPFVIQTRDVGVPSRRADDIALSRANRLRRSPQLRKASAASTPPLAPSRSHHRRAAQPHPRPCTPPPT